MSSQESDLGIIEITPAALASLVSQVTTQTYGVVGMAMPTLRGELAASLTRDPNKGVKLSYTDEGQLVVDVYVILNYGTNIASIANNLISALRYHLHSHANQAVQQVNVHIQGVRETLGD
jgi:uncharacterized alkaline shock family protein YloU